MKICLSLSLSLSLSLCMPLVVVLLDQPVVLFAVADCHASLSLCCNRSFDLFKSFFGQLRRNPACRPHYMLYLLGSGGIGKSVLMSILNAALSGCDVRDVASLVQQLEKGYGRNMLEAKPLLVFHEVDAAPPNALERLKSLVTENQLSLAEKFKPSAVIPVYARFVMLINEYQKVPLRSEPHEARRVLYLHTPVKSEDVEELMQAIFAIKNCRERAIHAGLALLDSWARESPAELPGLPPSTEVKTRVMRAFSGERGIHGHLTSFLQTCQADDQQPTGSHFFGWLQSQHIKHRFTIGQLDAMVAGRIGMDSYFNLMHEAHTMLSTDDLSEMVDCDL